MGFYNLNPEVMRRQQNPDAGELLHRDGGNIASVIGRLSVEKPEIKDRIMSYLETIVPNTSDVERVELGPTETLQFKQKIPGAIHKWNGPEFGCGSHCSIKRWRDQNCADGPRESRGD
jgi:hypothetical protein